MKVAFGVALKEASRTKDFARRLRFQSYSKGIGFPSLATHPKRASNITKHFKPYILLEKSRAYQASNKSSFRCQFGREDATYKLGGPTLPHSFPERV